MDLLVWLEQTAFAACGDYVMDSSANWLKSTPLSSFVLDYFRVWPAKVIAAISLCLWTGVMYRGRMLPFIGQAF